MHFMCLLKGIKKKKTPSLLTTHAQDIWGRGTYQIMPEGYSQLNLECGKQYGTNSLFPSTKKLQEGKKGEI